ncbi:MHC class II transactivator isoform X2 [Triplophysa rosa]|uniref:MHC class II transactivator n=1 Tax=Triplophysa rosa TaxID=992332 RepID=A0A9W7TQU3_TRIRA|nr:MHC class II transactivator isoform X2 [Triplophysa rosa]KAI7803593.1 putative MHC class II transactivator [Triplophysa rosa]
MSTSHSCYPVMVPFEDVLFQVRKALQVGPSLLYGLLEELHEARVFSTPFYRSLFKDGGQSLAEILFNDEEDLARRLSLPIWQKWDVSQVILDSALNIEEDLSAFLNSPDAESQDMIDTIDSGLDLLPDQLVSDIIDSILSEDYFEDILDPSILEDDFNFPCDADTACTLTSENAAILDQNITRKRKGKDASKSNKTPTKRNRKATACLESPPNRSTPTIASEGNFHSFNSFQHVLQLSSIPPITNITAFDSPPFLSPSGGSALQIIQTSGSLARPLISTVVPFRHTYVIVSPQPVSPVTQILPVSPAVGTVAPPELTVAVLPVGTLSDSASKGLPSHPVDTLSPTKVDSSNTCVLADGKPRKNIDSPPPKPAAKVRPEAPKCVKDFIHRAKPYIRNVCSAMRGGLGMESHYIDMHLIPRKLLIKSGKNANKCLEKELVVLSDSERKKSQLDRSQVFQNNLPRPKHSIAILGKTGVGKTAMIQRLCLDWASGSLSQFQFVFLLDCKNLDLKKSSYSLKHLLFDLSVSPRCEESDAVFKHVLSSPEDVLIIFDSFDDIKDFEGLLQAPAKSPKDTKYTVKQLFSGLFQKEILPGCTLLIATRPKEVLNQVLRKMDSLLELCHFSPEDIELYTTKYFRDSSIQEKALQKIQNKKYIFSICSNPLLCWTTCFLLEHQDGNGEALPSTLTELYQKVTSKHLQLASRENSSLSNPKRKEIPQLCKTAWEGFKNHNTHINIDGSPELVDYCLKSGILASYGRENHFEDLYIQNLLGALHSVQSKQVNEKMLLAHSVVQQKKRKVQGESQDVMQSFVTGLLFQKARPDGVSILDGNVDVQAKRKAVETHLLNLKLNELNPARLLELFHCVYETSNAKFARLLLKKLPDNLSFCGTQLCSSDVYVICHLLQHSTTLKRTFSINLQETSIPISDLRELVELKCITSFWAHTGDTIALWEDLHHSNNELNLKGAIEKFTLNPLKATQGHHIENLPLLVHIHREKKLPMSDFVPTLNEGVPALRHLQKLEFELGVQNGPEMFPKLIEVLPSLQSLQHLDIEKNKIGDSGAEKLAGVLHFLASLKWLNLSQNCIGDAGVKKLAKALVRVPSLQSLSLYGNLIADNGAEELALVLPDMKLLQDLDVKFNKFTDIGAKKLSAALKNCTGMKSLELWNNCIPWGVFEHLHQQDPRIRSL